MQKIITITTDKQNGLYDITNEVVSVIRLSKVKTGIASVYARGSNCCNYDPGELRSPRETRNCRNYFSRQLTHKSAPGLCYRFYISHKGFILPSLNRRSLE